MKYAGNLTGAEFNRELNRVMGNDCTCGTCYHHNGECEKFARMGKCNTYNKFGNRMREKELVANEKDDYCE